MNEKRTTIVDVAERAGVAKGTVSRILNNYPNFRISEAARARVKKAVVDLNYIPHIGAASLAGKQTRIIAVIWPVSSAPVELALMKRISSQLQENGYMPYICDIPTDFLEAKCLVEDLAQRGVDGMIIAGSNVATVVNNEFYNRFKAVVVETSIPFDITGCDQVVRNQITAFQEAAEHFARIGRHHPLLVMSGQSANPAEMSFTGMSVDHSYDVTVYGSRGVTGQGDAQLKVQINNNDAEFGGDIRYCNTAYEGMVVFTNVQVRTDGTINLDFFATGAGPAGDRKDYAYISAIRIGLPPPPPSGTLIIIQ